MRKVLLQWDEDAKDGKDGGCQGFFRHNGQGSEFERKGRVEQIDCDKRIKDLGRSRFSLNGVVVFSIIYRSSAALFSQRHLAVVVLYANSFSELLVIRSWDLCFFPLFVVVSGVVLAIAQVGCVCHARLTSFSLKLPLC
ncbi:hypothetical protein HPP92_004198 [Vanilla planifolia]|uniref:Uncharacterized protein n=1 Tax=Vanilla planifolia TaxID=51239 RepID=A0A835RIS7_VANPL|nr:hypothetical protein HPP92_004646 [Vanilla planifolia]KAG0493204.1 hypothetical protein HPP92_004198 [Vanilla planifolia]